MDIGSTIGLILGGLLFIVFLGLFLGSVVWAYGDAQARGRSGCLVAILVAFLSWPLGLVAWLVFRPDETEKDDTQAAFIECPCGRHIPVHKRTAGTKITCPSCGAEVLVPELSRFRRILPREQDPTCRIE